MVKSSHSNLDLQTLKLVLDHDVVYGDIAGFVDDLPQCLRHILRSQHVVPVLPELLHLPQPELLDDGGLSLVLQGSSEALSVHPAWLNIYNPHSGASELLPGGESQLLNFPLFSSQPQ